MTIQQTIELFKELEKGREDISIGFHLHKPISRLVEIDWRTNQNYPNTFSGFLQALADAEMPEL